jgi:hypothetical protein
MNIPKLLDESSCVIVLAMYESWSTYFGKRVL